MATGAKTNSNAMENITDTIGEAAYVVPLERLGQEPEWIDCPYCHQRTRTRVNKEDSTVTVLAGVLLCLICVCAACLPCACGWCQDVDHYCSKCNQKVAHRPHDGNVEVIYPPNARVVPSQYTVAQSQDMNLEQPAPAYSPTPQMEARALEQEREYLQHPQQESGVAYGK